MDDPAYICSDPSKILYVPPVVKTCKEDPNQEKCIVTCAKDMEQPKCSCTDFPKALKCVPPPPNCVKDPTATGCPPVVKTCTEDPT